MTQNRVADGQRDLVGPADVREHLVSLPIWVLAPVAEVTLGKHGEVAHARSLVRRQRHGDE